MGDAISLNSPASTIELPRQHTAPDGGTRAWLKVVGGFLIYVNTYGLAASFGSYQDYYQTNSLREYSPSTIAWIGTGQLFLLGFTGILSGPLYDRGYGKLLLGGGCFLQAFGLFMLSAGLVWVPAVSVISNNFTLKRPVANGLAATGAACGGVIMPVMFRKISSVIGFDWINRVFGFMILANSIVAAALLQPKASPHARQSPRLFDVDALREPAYLVFCIGLFFVELGYWIPPFMITTYAQFALGASLDTSFYLLAVMNAGSLAGRVLPAFAAQIPFIGPAWTVVAGVVALGVLVLSWLGITSLAGLIVWCVLVGFMSGIVVSLPNAVIPRLSPSASVVGARTGMMSGFISIAALVGTPIAQALVGTTNQDYRAGQLFSGTTILFGAALLVGPAIKISKKEPGLLE